MTALLLATSLAFWVEPTLHIRAAEQAYRQGRVAAQTQNSTSAKNYFDQAIQIEPDYLEAYDGLARTMLAAGRTYEAGRALSRLVQIYPRSTVHRVMLGDLLLHIGEKARALAQYSIALKEDNASADALFGFAKAAAAQGLNDKAAAAMARGRQSYPEDRRFLGSGTQ